MKVKIKFENVIGYSKTTIQILEDVVDGLNDGTYATIQEAIDDVLDSSLIYYDDQWDIMKDFQSPSQANYYDAVDELVDFIYRTIYEEN